MLPNRITEPLSPPTSPRMSGKNKQPADPPWHAQQAPPTNVNSHGVETRLSAQSPFILPPYAPGDNSQRSQLLQQGALTQAPGPSNELHRQRTTGQTREVEPRDEGFGAPRRDFPRSFPATLSQGAYATMERINSPPLSSDKGREAPDDDDEDMELEMEDEGEDGSRRTMTAAELRHQKRKMKRFRLTHNQTRFLMSEFARQAHPDAVQRERLSREIPGLSPRQVQVWFQNRRAKLKRLTAEDRDRMMRSRALPDDFIVPPAMSAQYGGHGMDMGHVAAGQMPHAPATHGPPYVRPLTLDTLRRGGPDHDFVSPTGANPALGSLAFTPPQSATDTASPVSTAGEAYGFSRGVGVGSPRRMAFAPGGSSAPMYSSQFGHGGRMPMYRRASGDSLASPLRSSMSYSPYSTSGSHPQDPRNPSTLVSESSSSQNQRDAQREMPPPPGPFGLGFGYENFPPQSHNPAQSPTSGPPSMHPVNTQYRNPSGALGGQGSQLPQYYEYHHANYPAPHMPNYPSFSGPYSAPLPSGPFVQHPGAGQNQPIVAPVPSQAQDFQHSNEQNTRQDEEEREQDRSEGGAHPLAPY